MVKVGGIFKDLQKNAVTVLRKLLCERWCTIGWSCFLRYNGLSNHRVSVKTVLNALMLWLKRTDSLLSCLWPERWKTPLFCLLHNSWQSSMSQNVQGWYLRRLYNVHAAGCFAEKIAGTKNVEPSLIYWRCKLRTSLPDHITCYCTVHSSHCQSFSALVC